MGQAKPEVSANNMALGYALHCGKVEFESRLLDRLLPGSVGPSKILIGAMRRARSGLPSGIGLSVNPVLHVLVCVVCVHEREMH